MEVRRVRVRIQTAQIAKNVTGTIGEVTAVLRINAKPFKSIVRRVPTTISPAGGLAANRLICLVYAGLIELKAARIIIQRAVMMEVLVNVIRPAHFILRVSVESGMNTFRTLACIGSGIRFRTGENPILF